ncbi:MAG: ABC-F family ATP-binding cassette domain-containing protein, partial [Myxococcota bacterium]
AEQADSDPARLDSLLASQAEVAAEVERLGGWDLRHQARAMLGHLGVARPEQRVGTMSGGERRRVALARLLVSAPDLAILDEPTNHLDIATIEWLERFLVERFSGSLLLITHDRYLLDRVVTRTVEIADGQLHSYDGGWESFLLARAERQAHAERVAANQRNLARRELEWLRRSPSARTTKQKARVDRAHDLVAAAQSGTQDERSARVQVHGVRSGHTVLDARDLAVAVAGRTLVSGLDLTLGKGERVGIVGKNGAGKTTLLRVLLGDLAPAGGTVKRGKNTRAAYLDQSRGGLDDSQTVYDNVGDNRSHVSVAGKGGEQSITVHSYLERFLFRSSDQRKLVGSLSGGERARVALARTLREQANLVVLDEPTNDLDVTTLAAVEESLLDFPGTALIVTHDRWFLDRVATSILAFEEPEPESEGSGRRGSRSPAEPAAAATVVHVHGNYQRYLDYRAARTAERKRAAVEPGASKSSKS